jgi:hypothetical protein
MNPNKLDEEIINNINFDKYSKIKKINEVTIGYKKSNKKICNVSISSAITAKARIKLYIGFMDVINNEGRILYCDTDSIIASFSKENKIENKYLGKSKVIFNTKLEDTEITDATFALPKTYGVKFKNKKEIVKIKGFNNTCNYNKFK